MKTSESRINVFNRQRKHPVERESLRGFLEQLSAQLAPHSAFSVVLLSNNNMRNYNRKFGGHNRPTDVLSFPYETEPWEKPEGYLGDILISVEMAQQQKKSSLTNELKTLALHGLLHLLGYDHERDTGEMRALEHRLRGEFKLR